MEIVVGLARTWKMSGHRRDKAFSHYERHCTLRGSCVRHARRCEQRTLLIVKRLLSLPAAVVAVLASRFQLRPEQPLSLPAAVAALPTSRCQLRPDPAGPKLRLGLMNFLPLFRSAVEPMGLSLCEMLGSNPRTETLGRSHSEAVFSVTSLFGTCIPHMPAFARMKPSLEYVAQKLAATALQCCLVA